MAGSPPSCPLGPGLCALPGSVCIQPPAWHTPLKEATGPRLAAGGSADTVMSWEDRAQPLPWSWEAERVQASPRCPSGGWEHRRGVAQITAKGCNGVGGSSDGPSPRGLPWWLSGEGSACQHRRQEFDPWSEKILYSSGQLSPGSTATESVPWRAAPSLQLEKRRPSAAKINKITYI